jgi:hypothetical protein
MDGNKTLLSMVADFINLDRDATIYARKPWTPASESTLEVDELDSTEPRDGLDYFLEVEVAAVFLSDLSETDLRRRCERLIQYAVNDC